MPLLVCACLITCLSMWFGAHLRAIGLMCLSAVIMTVYMYSIHVCTPIRLCACVLFYTPVRQCAHVPIFLSRARQVGKVIVVGATDKRGPEVLRWDMADSVIDAVKQVSSAERWRWKLGPAVE